MNLLDFSHALPCNETKERIKAASDSCHLGQDDACLVVYPVHYKGQSMTAYLKICRDIEDNLIKFNMELSHEISMHFLPAQDDECADSRSQFSRAKLATSVTSGQNSSWLNSEVFHTFGGRLDNIPLAKMKDLRTRYVAEVGPVDDNRLSPAERATQRGPQAYAHILEFLFQGMELTPDDKVMVTDWNIQGTEKAEAIWILQRKCESEPAASLPMMLYIGMFVVADTNEGSPEATKAISRMETLLLKEFWENQPEAGPVEPTKRPEDFVKKPELLLFTWSSTGKPLLPDIVKNRFEDGDVRTTWISMVDDAISELDGLVDGGMSRVAGGVDSLLPGPAMNSGPQPIDLNKQQAFDSVEAVDFTQTNTLLDFAVDVCCVEITDGCSLKPTFACCFVWYCT